MRKGNSTRVDKGLDPGEPRGRKGGREEGGVEKGEPRENMLGAALEEKISGRLRRGFYCKIHAKRGEARRERARARNRV